MDFLEDQLNTVRIIELEKNVTILEDNIRILSTEIKELQTYLIKFAKNQAELTKRVSYWPYVVVPGKDYEDDDDIPF